MIHYLQDLPSNVAGFRAEGTITEKDFTDTVIPKVQALIDETDRLNYLLIMETSIKDFTFGAWMKDVLMGIKHITKWNRAAIVTDVEAVRTFTDIFSIFIPGEFRGFEPKNLQDAIDWVSEKK